MAGNLNDSPAYRGRKIRGYKLGGSRPRSSSDICRGGVPIFDLDSRVIRRRGGERESEPLSRPRVDPRSRYDNRISNSPLCDVITGLTYRRVVSLCLLGPWKRKRSLFLGEWTRAPLAEDKLQFIVRGRIFLVVFVGGICDKKKIGKLMQLCLWWTFFQSFTRRYLRILKCYDLKNDRLIFISWEIQNMYSVIFCKKWW